MSISDALSAEARPSTSAKIVSQLGALIAAIKKRSASYSSNYETERLSVSREQSLPICR